MYKITCLVNGKGYVGKTKQKLEARISGHKSKSKTAKSGVDAAIRIHKWENFTVEIIEECPIEQLDKREMFWIAELKTKTPNGYNLTDGGDGNRGFPYSPEALAKMSAAHKGKPHSKEHKANIAAAKKGKKRKPFSEEHKAKISVALTGIKRSPETRARMSVAQKATGNVPPSQE
ncbi:MAG: GIY-YIG nuclease family protein, partial [Selenomonadaceae bacterium]|nr:GIY-YIG nuclease family protein [Selenomonadaceae bacterium]